MQLARLLRTVRHLRPIQIIDRIRRRLSWRRPAEGPASAVRAIRTTLPAFVSRHSGWDGGDNFCLLGRKHTITSAVDWNAADAPKLWLYHLHYFEDLVRADANVWRDRHALLIRRWIAENPPVGGNGWEPYPIALRSVLWIKWALAGGNLDTAMRDSLALQLRHLENNLEFHLLGNHLWADAKALLCAGLYFEGAEADRWYRRGLGLLETERKEQILADGGHFELSPVYHCLILEDMLDLIALTRCYGRPLDMQWEESAKKMLGWLAVMTRPDGHVVAWNDAATNAAPKPAMLFDYAARLGIVSPQRSAGLNHLETSGYVRADHGHFTLWFDAGPIGPDYIPGHAHADTLNIEIFGGERAVVVDTGTSTYALGDKRAYERGTTAHNTVVIDGSNSSEVWAGFRVGRRARPIDVMIDPQQLTAAHDGYCHIGAVHRRTIDLTAHAKIIICDHIERQHAGTAIAYFHLAPELRPQLDRETVKTEAATFNFTGAASVEVQPCEIAEGFNILKPSLCIAVTFDRDLITIITP